MNIRQPIYLSILITVLSTSAQAKYERLIDTGSIICQEVAIPENKKVNSLISDVFKAMSNVPELELMCNKELTKVALRRLKYGHLCRDIKLDPTLASKVRSNLECGMRMTPIKVPEMCKNVLATETIKLLKIHEKLVAGKPDSSPQELHSDLLTIYLNRLVAEGRRAPGRNALNTLVTNNWFGGIGAGLLKENFGIDSKGADYEVCVEQALSFLNSDTPESTYLRFKGYTLDFYDETKKSDNSGQSTHAYVQITAPDGKGYVFDSWRGETKILNPSLNEQFKGTTSHPERKMKPLKSL